MVCTIEANTLKEMNDVYNVLTGIVIKPGPRWEISVFFAHSSQNTLYFEGSR